MHSLCGYNKPYSQWSFTVTSCGVFLSPVSGPSLHHFNGTTSTERHWWRTGCHPSSIITQRTTSGSILWDPMWCRTCICWLVNQSLAWLNKTNWILNSIWVPTKGQKNWWKNADGKILDWYLESTLTIHQLFLWGTFEYIIGNGRLTLLQLFLSEMNTFLL